jgi:hypothetical protein
VLHTHPCLRTPGPPARLWRYTDFAKFLFLLERRALWFSRLDTLGDPYEGLPTRPLIDAMWKATTSAPDSEQAARRKLMNHNLGALAMGRDVMAVSCWHIRKGESAAMWDLYGGRGEGIAIVTSVARLARSLQAEPTIYGGMVRYVDYQSHKPAEPFNVFDWATLKRSSFSHEREFRAILPFHTGPLRAGAAVAVDLAALVEAVYVSPSTHPWWVEVVRDVCRRYQMNVPVQQSDLLRHPAYMKQRAKDDMVAAAALANTPLQPTSRARRSNLSKAKRAARG